MDSFLDDLTNSGDLDKIEDIVREVVAGRIKEVFDAYVAQAMYSEALEYAIQEIIMRTTNTPLNREGMWAVSSIEDQVHGVICTPLGDLTKGYDDISSELVWALEDLKPGVKQKIQKIVASAITHMTGVTP